MFNTLFLYYVLLVQVASSIDPPSQEKRVLVTTERFLVCAESAANQMAGLGYLCLYSSNIGYIGLMHMQIIMMDYITAPLQLMVPTTKKVFQVSQDTLSLGLGMRLRCKPLYM